MPLLERPLQGLGAAGAEVAPGREALGRHVVNQGMHVETGLSRQAARDPQQPLTRESPDEVHDGRRLR